VAVEGVMCCLMTPFTLPKPGFRLLVPGVFNSIDAHSKDIVGGGACP